MAKIKVKYGGCGIKYTDANGVERHALKTPENGPFECDDAQAARLVGMGVADYVNEDGWLKVADETPAPQADAQQEEATQEPEEPAQEPVDLEKLDYNDLKALAADMGVVPKGKKKSDYIAAIVAAQNVAAQADNDDVDDPDNDLPVLSAADPE